MPRSAADATDGNTFLRPASSAVRYSHAASGGVRISQISGDRLDRGESEYDRAGLSCRSSSPAAIRRSAAKELVRLQNLLSIRQDFFPDRYPVTPGDFSSSITAGQRAGGLPAMLHVAGLRGSAVNITRKPCLTKNRARKNDTGAPQDDNRQSRPVSGDRIRSARGRCRRQS